jgi:hypothetical protein
VVSVVGLVVVHLDVGVLGIDGSTLRHLKLDPSVDKQRTHALGAVTWPDIGSPMSCHVALRCLARSHRLVEVIAMLSTS